MQRTREAQHFNHLAYNLKLSGSHNVSAEAIYTPLFEQEDPLTFQEAQETLAAQATSHGRQWSRSDNGNSHGKSA